MCFETRVISIPIPTYISPFLSLHAEEERGKCYTRTGWEETICQINLIRQNRTWNTSLYVSLKILIELTFPLNIIITSNEQIRKFLSPNKDPWIPVLLEKFISKIRVIRLAEVEVKSSFGHQEGRKEGSN